MSIRVLVNGANGKMGQLAVKTLSNHPELTLAGKSTRADDLSKVIQTTGANVVVDLTNADSVFQNTKTIIETGAHPVIGTSGLLKDQIEQLQAKCHEKQLGGIIAPNFSIGALLMMKYVGEFAKYFHDVEIIEMHHPGKLDSPSGTAIRTAENIAQGRLKNANSTKSFKETIPGARGAYYKEVPIHAIRLPGLIAHQQVLFGGTGETLTLKHDTIDRECFMPGLILACKKAIALKNLIYGLENLL